MEEWRSLPGSEGSEGSQGPDGAEGFDAVYVAERPAIVRLAFLLVRDQAVAEELAQEAFLRLFAHYATVENPPGFLRTVVVRLAVDSIGAVKDAEIIPSTGDRKYDTALKRVALGWKFRAARGPDNRPVAVLFDVTFTF